MNEQNDTLDTLIGGVERIEEAGGGNLRFVCYILRDDHKEPGPNIVIGREPLKEALPMAVAKVGWSLATAIGGQIARITTQLLH